MPASLDSTRRFTDRADDYVRYRPSYPDGIIQTLRQHAGLTAAARVADIASGTGILTQLLLPHAARVFGIEPNAAMRHAGENQLGAFAHFTSCEGTAEATGLPTASVDLVTAAQAFHWFDPPAARREFLRILRPGGQVAIVWNDRPADATPFLADYAHFTKRHAIDSTATAHEKLKPAHLAPFFGPAGYATAEFPNEQHFDFTGLKGRVLSSSNMPNIGHPGHAAMIADLAALYARHARDDSVTFHYTARVHYAPFS